MSKIAKITLISSSVLLGRINVVSEKLDETNSCDFKLTSRVHDAAKLK